MIDLLIRENETHVTEIIRRVVSTISSNGSPVNLPPTNTVTLPSMIPIEKQLSRTGIVPPAGFGSFNATAANPQAVQTNASRPTPPTSSVNVWEQRAAIRKMKSEDSAPGQKYSGKCLRLLNLPYNV
jgi:hypothetical protein